MISGGVGVTDELGASNVQWSPDARHILLSSAASVELLDDAGTVLTRIDRAVSAAWVDSSTYATATACLSGAYIGYIATHSIGGGVSLIDGYFDTTDLVANGHGAVALSLRNPDSPQGKPTFAVWAGNKLSRVLPGTPVTWSPDGSNLLARADPTWGTPAAPQILSYPSLRLTTFSSSVLMGPVEMPVFSPDGRRIADPCGMTESAYFCQSMVLDAAGGVSRAVTPSQAAGLPMSWLENGRLLLQPEDQPAVGTFGEWDGARVVRSKLPAGAWAVASPDGRLVAIGTSPDPASGSTLVVTTTGAPVSRLPSTGGAFQWVTWSPDSSHLAVWDDSQHELDLVRVAG
jgi:hypothetical protein